MLALLLSNVFVFMLVYGISFMQHKSTSVPLQIIENTFSKVHQHGSVIHASVRARERFYFIPCEKQVSYLMHVPRWKNTTCIFLNFFSFAFLSTIPVLKIAQYLNYFSYPFFSTHHFTPVHCGEHHKESVLLQQCNFVLVILELLCFEKQTLWNNHQQIANGCKPAPFP